MTWHVWHTRPCRPSFTITDSRFTPLVGVGGTSTKNQKNGTTLLKIAQMKIYAKFRLDPCQPPEGVAWIPTKNRYNIHDDGLTSPWHGRVWLNPPYGKYTAAWLDRMHVHRNGVSLVFSRTDCAWFHESVAKADAILFLRGRVKFVDGLGKTGGSGAGSGSMLIAWGADNVAALEAMKDCGHLVYNA